MSLVIKEAVSKNEMKQFACLPFKLYKGNKLWVPPLITDEIDVLNPQKNPAFAHSEAKFWIALRNGKCVGRIGGIINKECNKKEAAKTARFTRFECENNQETANQLFQHAESWAKEKGMKEIKGPLGFNNLDMQGVLVEGFDYLQSFASVYHLPYYQQLIENEGYQKEVDWVEFRLTLGEKPVQKAKRGAELIKKRYDLEVMHFSNHEYLLAYSDRIFDILNDAFCDLPYVSAFNKQMKQYYKKKYIRYLNPAFVKMVKFKNDKEPIGFVIGMPSMSKAMQKANGYLFPFGWYHLLKAQKVKNNGDTMDQVLTGVLQEHQATGAGVILMAELQDAMLKKGLKYIETTGIFETNQNAIANWKNYENIQHKRKRAYIKNL